MNNKNKAKDDSDIIKSKKYFGDDLGKNYLLFMIK